MAQEYFPCYDSYLAKTRNLSDQELGRLFRALMIYHATGEPQKLAGRESMAYDFIVFDIDRASQAYDDKCAKSSTSARRRYDKEQKNDDAGTDCERMPTHPNASERRQLKTNTKANTIDLSNDKSNTPTPEKHKYGECANVLLTDDELEKLKEKFPSDWKNRIDNLSVGIALHGYKYKSHYLAVLKWAKDDAAKPAAASYPAKQQPVYGSGELGGAEAEAIRNALNAPMPWMQDGPQEEET